MSTDFSDGRPMPLLNSIFVITLFPLQKKTHVFFKVYCCSEEYF